MPGDLGTAVTPQDRFVKIAGSGVNLQSYILKYCNPVNLIEKNSRLCNRMPTAQEGNLQTCGNLTPTRKPIRLQCTGNYLGDVHSSVSLSENDFGKVPSFGLSRSETLSKKVTYSKQISARCDTARLQTKPGLLTKQTGTSCLGEKKMILDTNLDLDLLLVQHPTLQQRFELGSQ